MAGMKVHEIESYPIAAENRNTPPTILLESMFKGIRENVPNAPASKFRSGIEGTNSPRSIHPLIGLPFSACPFVPLRVRLNDGAYGDTMPHRTGLVTYRCELSGNGSLRPVVRSRDRALRDQESRQERFGIFREQRGQCWVRRASLDC